MSLKVGCLPSAAIQPELTIMNASYLCVMSWSRTSNSDDDDDDERLHNFYVSQRWTFHMMFFYQQINTCTNNELLTSFNQQRTIKRGSEAANVSGPTSSINLPFVLKFMDKFLFIYQVNKAFYKLLNLSTSISQNHIISHMINWLSYLT